MLPAVSVGNVRHVLCCTPLYIVDSGFLDNAFTFYPLFRLVFSVSIG